MLVIKSLAEVGLINTVAKGWFFLAFRDVFELNFSRLVGKKQVHSGH